MSREEQERRGFFRIDDEVILNYRLVSNDEFLQSNGLLVNESDSLTLVTELEKMKVSARIQFRHVESEMPEVARYFAHIENKIDLIARHIVMNEDGLFTENTQAVSISGSGLAFTAREELPIESHIELKFILKPSLLCIRTFSTVVSCLSEDNGEHKIAVEFSKLTEDDQDVLIRHVVQKQMNEIREHN